MAPKVTDFVFIKNTNPHDGSYKIEPALVVAVPDSDPTWNPDGDVVSVRSFSEDGVDTVGLQTGPATYDEDGVWNGGYAITNDGEEVDSLAKAPVRAPSSENPTMAGQGVSTSQVQQMIQAGNADLLAQIGAMIHGQDDNAPDPDAVPAPADTAEAQQEAHTAT